MILDQKGGKTVDLFSGRKWLQKGKQQAENRPKVSFQTKPEIKRKALFLVKGSNWTLKTKPTSKKKAGPGQKSGRKRLKREYEAENGQTNWVRNDFKKKLAISIFSRLESTQTGPKIRRM